MERQTNIITRTQIERVFDMNDYVATVEKAFKLYGLGKVQMPSKIYLYFKKGDLRCMPVYIPSLGIAGVKNVNVHPENRSMPAVMASITLIDPENGFPMAIMDGTHITKMRTGAAGGVAAKYLSRKNSRTAAFIGAGEQAKTQLQALLVTRPGITKILIYDISKDTAINFRKNASGKNKIEFQIAETIQEATSSADIVTTITPVRKPIIKNGFIGKGTHINAIGADAKGKQELDVQILKKSRIVIDNWEQASHSGEINVAVSKKMITKNHIYADIGEIVTGKKKGRESKDQITVFDSTGLAIQDITCAYEIYKKIINDKKEFAKVKKVSLF